MDARRRMVSRVLEDGLSVSGAAREAGVSRQTAHQWLARAKQGGLAQMKEASRRPLSSPGAISAEITLQILQIAEEHPYWGPQKLRAVLWPEDPPVCERTLARVLSRVGRRVRPPAARAATERFERESSNELWQIDFKKVGHRQMRKSSLSVLDDAHRFCIALGVVPDETLNAVWDVLWEAFGDFGLPCQILSDNGAAFRNGATWRWSQFELRLMLLGIDPIHGRPYHPQTQGKVERLHGTMEQELSFEKDADIAEVLQNCRDRYNWVRPHFALGLRTPGSLYTASTKKRPSRMPEPFFPAGAILRKVYDPGTLTYKSQKYKVGRAFIGQYAGILELDKPMLVWADRILGPLEDLKV